MGLFGRFKKNNDPPPQKLPNKIELIFEKLHHNLEAAAKVDKAISYRELGEHAKAIELLKEVIKKHPQYHPAKTVLGVTILHKGDVRQAECFFLDMLKNFAKNSDYPLTEVYGNLGVIRWKHFNDIEGAINFYKSGISDNSCSLIDKETYEIGRSSLHRDLCFIYFGQNNCEEAQRHAKIRLTIDNDCHIASKVLGICLLVEFLQNNDLFKYVLHDIKPMDLLYSAQCLETGLRQNINDYSLLGNAALVYFFLGMSAYIRNNPDLHKEYTVKSKHYSDILYEYAKHSEQAEQMRNNYEQIVSDFVQNINELK